jgi:hypothetical protein
MILYSDHHGLNVLLLALALLAALISSGFLSADQI